MTGIHKMARERLGLLIQEQFQPLAVDTCGEINRRMSNSAEKRMYFERSLFAYQ